MPQFAVQLIVFVEAEDEDEAKDKAQDGAYELLKDGNSLDVASVIEVE